MPDISMCINYDCPLKDSCYRFTAEANPFRQAYTSFDHKDCGYYWNNEDS